MQVEMRALVGEQNRPPTEDEMKEYLRLALNQRKVEECDYVSVTAVHTSLENVIDPLIDDPKRTLMLRASGFAHGDIQLLVMAWISEAIIAITLAEKMCGYMTPAMERAKAGLELTLERLVKDLIKIRKVERGLP